ncbi:MAG: hypothetical protein JNK17_02070 [Hydrogenophaga sp.]|nr:hypothetical protein [Hydrogenophaga sp.]
MSSRKGQGKHGSLDSAGLDDLAGLDGLGDDGDGLGGLDALGALEDLEAGASQKNPDDPIPELDYENMTNEEVAVAETSAVLAAFKARAKAEQERFTLATDSEYWVAVCFQTREQKEHFLEVTKLLKAGDKYIDGALVAKVLGITLPPAEVPYNVSTKVDAKYAALVKDL